MIITVTGKPCSGKGTACKILCEKYSFEYICTGDMFRSLAKQHGFDNILEFQQNSDIIKIDHMVDDSIKEIGEKRHNENIVIDSRLAWHFAPKSFKVFIDVDWDIAGERLLNANRASEQVSTITEAITKLKDRWEVENARYEKIYQTNNLNPDNYDLIISSNNKSPEEIAEEIYKNYQKVMQNA